MERGERDLSTSLDVDVANIKYFLILTTSRLIFAHRTSSNLSMSKSILEAVQTINLLPH